MKHIFFILSLCLLVFAAPAAGAGQEDMVAFLWGASALISSENLSESEKGRFFDRLVQVTGVTPKDAIDFVDRHQNRPEEWQKVLEEMIALAEDPPRNQVPEVDSAKADELTNTTP